MEKFDTKYLYGAFFLTVLHFPLKISCHMKNKGSIDLALNEHQERNLNDLSYQELNLKLPYSNLPRYVIVQGHSFSSAISISYKTRFQYPSLYTYNATSVGLTYLLGPTEYYITSYFMASNSATRALLTAVPYYTFDPIPGGCCTTCSFDDDPNLQATYDELRTKVKFQRANVFYSSGASPPFCDGDGYSTFRLVYDLYYFFLEENNFSEDELFSGLSKMSSLSAIKTYGTKLTTLTGNTFPEFKLERMQGIGVVFNVVVRDPNLNTEAAYTPSFTYACDLEDIQGSCRSLGATTTTVYCGIWGIIGLVMCFAGHRFFKLQLFFSGILTFWMVSYILFSRFTIFQYTIRMLSSTAVGILGGLLLLILYVKGSSRFLSACMLNSELLLGFMTACIVFFSPIGSYDVFKENTIFILTLISITLAVPIPLVFFPKAVSILFSSIFGSYGFVLAINYFIRARLSYILLNMILRFTIPKYEDVQLIVPFQTNEYILCGAWALIGILGIVAQCYMAKGKPFPPPKQERRLSFFQRRTKKLRQKMNGQRKANIPHADERTPLLKGNTIPSYDDTSTRPVNVV